MICVRCGHSNPEGNNYCEKCNQHLVKMAPAGADRTSLIVEEGYKYLAPQKSYPTKYLFDLTCRAKEYLEDDASGDPMLEAFHVIKIRLAEFEGTALPAIMEGLKSINLQYPTDDYPKQMAYLLNKGVALYHEGVALFESFIESGKNEEMVNGITKMQEGNDYVGVAEEFSGQVSELVGNIIAKIDRKLKIAAAKGHLGPDPDSEQAAADSATT